MKNFAMIGLGDIVIPGLFASMCLRCDLITAFENGKNKAIADGVKDKDLLIPYIDKEMGCFYFNSSLFGYFVGLSATYSAMIIMNSP
jgi:minor histocompatibility antigen H13